MPAAFGSIGQRHHVNLAGVLLVPQGGKDLELLKAQALVKAVGAVVIGVAAHLHGFDLEKGIALRPGGVFSCFEQRPARALPVAELANLLHECGLNGEVAPTLREALARAESLTGPRDLIFVSGSCYLVSDLLALMA